MTDKDTIRVVDLYINNLSKTVASKMGGTGQQHVLWMCETVKSWGPVFTPEEKEKAFRWLGFIQGVLWSRGLYSVDDMRIHNAPHVSGKVDY